MRLQIGLFGRTNVGKSSFLNMVANQNVALTSEVPGTTTDVVEKSMELLPVGPVTFLDTGGIDDTSVLAEKRIEKTMKILDRADLIILIAEPNIWTDFEDGIAERISAAGIPLLIAVNKTDLERPDDIFLNRLRQKSKYLMACSALESENRDKYINEAKRLILEMAPAEFSKPGPLIRDLLPERGTAVFIVPIDNEAPKGRLILPQVQSIRDILDGNQIAVTVKDTEYPYVLETLGRKPDLVVCDSQVVMKMVPDTPPDVKCTTFSILFSRFKGDIVEEARGVAAIDKLRDGDKVLLAEACSHHPNEDDIGRVKIPRWLREYRGIDVQFDIYSGRDYPDDLEEYKVIIHCGGCMITRTEKLVRIQKAKARGLPITNYGILISHMHGVLERVLEPFPEALEAYLK